MKDSSQVFYSSPGYFSVHTNMSQQETYTTIDQICSLELELENLNELLRFLFYSLNNG